MSEMHAGQIQGDRSVPVEELRILPLGEILVRTVGLDPEKIDEALERQAESGGRIGEILVAMKAVTEEEMLRALALQLDLPFVEKLSGDAIDSELVRRIPINFARQFRLIPVARTPEGVEVATADPLAVDALDQARLSLGAPVFPVVATSQTVIDAIHSVYERIAHEADIGEELDAEEHDNLAQEVEEAPDLIDSGDDEAPIIRLVNWLLKRAVKERASDIHIEPFEKEVIVRFRVDGVLKEVIKPPKRFQKAITSRIKIMGQLNIAETRLPQDGRIRIKIAGKEVDIRLSTVPTTWGESCVMRLLDKSNVLLNLEEIG